MRHMMPKEILDAVDLQRQYRTFSGTRDYMLQRARQRADVHVEMCSFRQRKLVQSRVSAHTNNPTATQTTTPVPMDVSQMSSNVSKLKQRNRRENRTNTSKTRNPMAKELVPSVE